MAPDRLTGRSAGGANIRGTKCPLIHLICRGLSHVKLPQSAIITQTHQSDGLFFRLLWLYLIGVNMTGSGIASRYWCQRDRTLTRIWGVIPPSPNPAGRSEKHETCMRRVGEGSSLKS